MTAPSRAGAACWMRGRYSLQSVFCGGLPHWLGSVVAVEYHTPMSTSKLPQTDSIQELAKFWDTHDLTEFEHELEEVGEQVFQREAEIRVHLESKEAEAVRRMAESQGVPDSELIRQWVLERIGTP